MVQEVLDNDFSMLKSYSTFGGKCGDSLAVLNVETIKGELDIADGWLASCLIFSGICMLWYLLEIVSLVMCLIPFKAIS
jgi:hypothetical protein